MMVILMGITAFLQQVEFALNEQPCQVQFILLFLYALGSKTSLQSTTIDKLNKGILMSP